ncbi:MAG: hypothetical protein ABL995_03910 [Bryobacteraceae bacterium]
MPELTNNPARDELHRLLDAIPSGQIGTAKKLLESLADPVRNALANAPLDDEPETPEEIAAVDAVLADPAADLPFEQIRRRK